MKEDRRDNQQSKEALPYTFDAVESSLVRTLETKVLPSTPHPEPSGFRKSSSGWYHHAQGTAKRICSNSWM